MKLRDLFFVYGNSVVYRLLFKFPDRKPVEAGIYTFDELKEVDELFHDYDVLYHHGSETGKMTVVIAK